MSRARNSSKRSFNTTGFGTSNKPSMKNREHPSVPTNTQLTGFVARGPRASQPCAISKDVESS